MGAPRCSGSDVTRHPQTVRESIGLAGQYAAIDENLTRRENLKLVGRLTHLPTSDVTGRADELLERFGLTDAANRDLHKGLIERFRSLPMARSAVLAGRTIADATRNAFVMVLMTAVGFLVGFRIHEGIAAYVGALASSCSSPTRSPGWRRRSGLGASNGEAAQAAMFPMVFPLVFASSAFVDTSFMPGWLQAFANHQPVSVTIDAARDLVLGTPVGRSVVGSIAWSLGIVAVFGPLAVRRYRRAT